MLKKCYLIITFYDVKNECSTWGTIILNGFLGLSMFQCYHPSKIHCLQNTISCTFSMDTLKIFMRANIFDVYVK